MYIAFFRGDLINIIPRPPPKVNHILNLNFPFLIWVCSNIKLLDFCHFLQYRMSNISNSNFNFFINTCSQIILK